MKKNTDRNPIIFSKNESNSTNYSISNSNQSTTNNTKSNKILQISLNNVNSYQKCVPKKDNYYYKKINNSKEQISTKLEKQKITKKNLINNQNTFNYAFKKTEPFKIVNDQLKNNKLKLIKNNYNLYDKSNNNISINVDTFNSNNNKNNNKNINLFKNSFLNKINLLNSLNNLNNSLSTSKNKNINNNNSVKIIKNSKKKEISLEIQNEKISNKNKTSKYLDKFIKISSSNNINNKNNSQNTLFNCKSYKNLPLKTNNYKIYLKEKNTIETYSNKRIKKINSFKGNISPNKNNNKNLVFENYKKTFIKNTNNLNQSEKSNKKSYIDKNSIEYKKTNEIKKNNIKNKIISYSINNNIRNKFYNQIMET